MVEIAGYDPATFRLQGGRSSQLSYIPKYRKFFYLLLTKEGLIFKCHSPTNVAGHGWYPQRDLNSHAFAHDPKSCVSAIPP